MDRHTSNPFLSDWDESPAQDVATNIVRHTFASGGFEPAQQQPQQQQPARRSSCSQAELGSQSASGTAARQGLYRRNMSSFEAASLQLEQHQQQMLENGSTNVTHKDLIAKMTAEFQSAINANDKQFDATGLDLNLFDPFETIVDDDVSLVAPAGAAETNNEAETNNGNLSRENKRQSHDSIDDDEDELVSTPVRNIKSSEPHEKGTVDSEPAESGSSSSRPARSAVASVQDSSDSRAKASLFASLLASAESQNQQNLSGAMPPPDDDAGELEPSNDDKQDQDRGQIVDAKPTHVIKGSTSPVGASGSAEPTERPVGFFDPFETVIDKDALSELMGASGTANGINHRPFDQANQADGCQASVADKQQRQNVVAESASIETVVETSTTKDDGELNSNEKACADSSAISKVPAQTMYDSSKALSRPAGRKCEQAALPDAPRSTPLRASKQATTKSKQQRKSSFQEDSSDSDEEDDRIRIVIRSKDSCAQEQASGQTAADQNKPTVVPLLPPPPSKSSMRQARERGQFDDVGSPSNTIGFKARKKSESSSSLSAADEIEQARNNETSAAEPESIDGSKMRNECMNDDDDNDNDDDDGQFIIPVRPGDIDDDEVGDSYGKSDTPLYDDDTSYVLEEYPTKYDGPGWDMMLRYPPKKKLTSNRFWKKIFVKLAQVPLVDTKSKLQNDQADQQQQQQQQTCWALQIYDKQEDKKPMQEIPIQATYTVSEISSQLFDQFGKIFTIKLQYIFYKERVGVRQGQLARFIHTGHIGASTTSGGHGVDPISIGAIKRIGAPIEHSPQISHIIKLGCMDYEAIKQFRDTLEDCLFRIPILRDRALSTYKTEEVQMAVRDETYIEINQIGTVTRQMARVRLFFLSFLNGMPTVEVGINDIHRQGHEVVGRMDILPVVTEEWIRLEAWELHSTVDKDEFENVDSRLVKLSPPDATFFELIRFRVRPPRNRELPLQISAQMSVTRTRVSIDCDAMIPGCVSRKHGQIPCENIAIRIHIPECWIYFFREEKHFRMGSKKSVNRRPGKVKGIERFLGGSSGLPDLDNDSSLIEVTSGQAKYEHHHRAIVWRAAKWPKDSQAAYVQNSMKIRLPLTAYDKIPENFYEFVHAEYTMPATTVSHTTLRSISVTPCDDEPPEKYVKYSAKYEYKVKMRLSINIGTNAPAQEQEASPIIITKPPDISNNLQKEEDSNDDDDDDEVDDSDEPEVPAAENSD